jgi:hypothetical protein
MIRRCFITGIAALGALLSTSACGEAGNEALGGGKRYPDYRYRLTVEVDTPEGLRSGSSVIEVSTRMSGRNSLQPDKVSARVRGEAVTVDLGNRGTMFALLRSEKSVDWAKGPLMLFVPPIPYKDIEHILEKENRDPSFDMRMTQMYKLRGKYALPRHYSNARPIPKESDRPTAYPIMVTFADMADPKSVTKLDPDNLSAQFGKGVKLKRVTVERTDDAVTSGIEKRLAWLNNLSNYQKDPNNIFTSTLPSEVAYLRRK